MTEDKADKALREVIINFTNQPYNIVTSEDEMIKIDVTDQLPKGYYLDSITVNRGGSNVHTIEFMESDKLRGIADDIDTILDATLVNAKQRESVGQLIKQCIYKDRGRWGMWYNIIATVGGG